MRNKKHFPFVYLQRTGAGSRSLCFLAVSPSLEWHGSQVASIAKSGGMIYIMAIEDLPGLTLNVDAQEVSVIKIEF